jgi:hypothetical protein
MFNARQNVIAKVRKVAADALTGAISVDRRGPWVRPAGHPFEVTVHEVDNRLDALPAGRAVAEAVPRLVAKLVWEAETARHDERDVLVGQRHNRRLGRARGDPVARRRQHYLRLVRRFATRLLRT